MLCRPPSRPGVGWAVSVSTPWPSLAEQMMTVIIVSWRASFLPAVIAGRP